MAKNQPRGADGNVLSWTHIFNRDEGNLIRARVSRSGTIDLYSQRGELTRELGRTRVDKIVKARYDWLFDDLQQFTSIDPTSIETKEDLKAFVEETIGKSKGFQSMQANNPRKYDASVARAVNSLWLDGDVKQVARTNVVEVVVPERAKEFSKQVKNPASRKVFIDASDRKELFRIRREQFAIRRRDKRGRMYHYDPITGRRVRNPNFILEEIGFD